MPERTCQIDDCPTRIASRGLCQKHLHRLKRNGHPLALRGDIPKPRRICTIDDCDKTYASNGYCYMHRRRWRVHGDPHVSLIDRAHAALCSAPGCTAAYRARGYCEMHYQRLVNKGTTEGSRRLTSAERFWAKVSEGPGDCWTWTATLDRKGYGQFPGAAQGESTQAHRWAYEFLVGEIPAGLELDHVCHTQSDCTAGSLCPHRRCVNPYHMEPVTHAENIRRGNRHSHRPGKRGRRWLADSLPRT
jgi:hypothetical protein